VLAIVQRTMMNVRRLAVTAGSGMSSPKVPQRPSPPPPRAQLSSYVTPPQDERRPVADSAAEHAVSPTPHFARTRLVVDSNHPRERYTPRTVTTRAADDDSTTPSRTAAFLHSAAEHWRRVLTPNVRSPPEQPSSTSTAAATTRTDPRRVSPLTPPIPADLVMKPLPHRIESPYTSPYAFKGALFHAQ